MTVYQRSAGAYIAEREQPEPGSDRESELDRLAEDEKSDWSRVEDEPADSGEGGPKRPAKNASKEDWVAWAVSQGAERDEADKSTKDDLVKAYGG